MKLSILTKVTAVVLLMPLSGLLTSPQFSTAQARIKFLPPPPPNPGSGDPGGRGNAGRRGPCGEKYKAVTALVPTPQVNLPEYQWGLTVSDRPTIWFNVPSGIDAGTLVEWRLRDSKGKTLHKMVSHLPKTNPGVIGFEVPNRLAIATYQWDLAIYCGSTNASDQSGAAPDRPSIWKGEIQRVAIPTTLQQELAIAKTPLERANRYAQYGIWYDALTTLGQQMRSGQPREVSLAWSDLLKQQQLDGKTAATVTPCCKLKN